MNSTIRSSDRRATGRWIRATVAACTMVAAGTLPAWAGPMDDAMSAQGGTPPADARDPHAYADGLTLERGAYALPGPRQLRLGDEAVSVTGRLDRLEIQRRGRDGQGVYDGKLRAGRDNDALLLKAEGELNDGRLADSRTEALWTHAVHPFWDAQVGLRHDHGTGPDRDWLALGVQGLAPYWFGLDATAYVGEHGRTALRLDADYDLLLTQRWVLQPRMEMNFFGKTDPARGLGSGISDVSAGLRLRYEIRREIAPYLGAEWTSLRGGTADAARASGEPVRAMRVVAGLRLWF